MAAINCVATDEICCTLAKKLQGARIDDTTGGNAGVEPRVALMYTEMVGKRGYSLSRYVDLVSTNAAKIMGLYPRKGALAAGSDADICVLDPADQRVIRAEDLHETDYTPWEGHKMEAWPCLTILRGKVVVESGTWKGALSDGKWQHRKVAEEMFAGPRLYASRDRFLREMRERTEALCPARACSGRSSRGKRHRVHSFAMARKNDTHATRRTDRADHRRIARHRPCHRARPSRPRAPTSRSATSTTAPRPTRPRRKSTTLGRRAMHRSLDVADTAATRAFAAEAAAAFGPIDILFNNAGMNIRKKFEDYTEAEFDRIVAVHLKGMFFMAQAVYPAMVARGRGCIINVASQRGLKGAVNSYAVFRGEGGDHRLHPSAGLGGDATRRARQRHRAGADRYRPDRDHGTRRSPGLHRCAAGPPLRPPGGDRRHRSIACRAARRVLCRRLPVAERRGRDVPDVRMPLGLVRKRRHLTGLS